MMTSIRAPDLIPLRPNWLVRRHERVVRSYPSGIDPAIIADDLGLTTRTVIMIQMKLGLRRPRTHSDYRE
jgi:hypothetical protein